MSSFLGLFPPLFCVVDLETSSDCDASCWSAYDAKQTAYCGGCRARSADHCAQFLLACAEVQMVACAEVQEAPHLFTQVVGVYIC